MPEEPPVAVATARRAGCTVAVAFAGHVILDVRRSASRCHHPCTELARDYTATTVFHDGHLDTAPDLPCAKTIVPMNHVRAHFGATTHRRLGTAILTHYPQLRRFVPTRADGTPFMRDRRHTLILLTVGLGMTGLDIPPTPYDQAFHTAQSRALVRRPR